MKLPNWRISSMLSPMQLFVRHRRTLLIVICLLCLVNYLQWKYIQQQSNNQRQEIAKATDAFLKKLHGRTVQTQADKVRAEAVKDMARFAWKGYYHLCALRQSGNELGPVTNSCSPFSDVFTGPNNLLTVIDSLDTLLLMNLTDEYEQARDLVKHNFTLANAAAEVSVFETTIRVLGGLLGAFSLSEDPMFGQLAVQVADAMAGALENGRFPRLATVLSTGHSTEQHDQKVLQKLQLAQREVFVGPKTNLAEVGSLYLELAYLSELTGDNKYQAWADRYQQALIGLTSLDGLFPIILTAQHPWHLKPVGVTYSTGSGGDSFYEYLVKRCLFDARMKADCIAQFTASLDGIMKHLSVKTADNNLCITSMNEGDNDKQCVMEHLTCFAGGMFAMAYLQVDQNRTDWLEFAEKVTQTCYLSYIHTKTGLGPEIFSFDQRTWRLVASDGRYLLRPETVESIYYLYQVTGKQMYRDWGWDIIIALNTTARTASGFSGLISVMGEGSFDNTQYSFFLAETLKYLYLLFSPADKLRLDQWVFNTEAHVIPSRGNHLREKVMGSINKSGILWRLLTKFLY